MVALFTKLYTLEVDFMNIYGGCFGLGSVDGFCFWWPMLQLFEPLCCIRTAAAAYCLLDIANALI